MQLWNLQSNEKTRAKRKLKGSTPEGSDPKDSPTTTTTTTFVVAQLQFFSLNNERQVEEETSSSSQKEKEEDERKIQVNPIDMKEKRKYMGVFFGSERVKAGPCAATSPVMNSVLIILLVMNLYLL